MLRDENYHKLKGFFFFFFETLGFLDIGPCFIEKVVMCVYVTIANRHRNKP